MMNEVLFFIFLFGGLSLALLASYFGRAFLYTLIVIFTLYIGVTEHKMIEVFSLPVTFGAIFYGIIFFCTDILTERYGTRAGYSAVRYGVISMLIFQILMQLTLLANTYPQSEAFASALDAVFSYPTRVLVAGLVAYGVSQTFDIWLYQKIREKTEGQHLWIRNNASTMVSQIFASFLFAFLAFFGTGEDWIGLAFASYGIRILVAVIDTPFMYISTLISPRDFRKYTEQMQQWDETMMAEKEVAEREKIETNPVNQSN